MRIPKSTAIVAVVLVIGVSAYRVLRFYPVSHLRSFNPHPNVVVAPARRIRLGTIENARFIRKVEPVYPDQSKAARTGGTVEIHIVIGTDGKVKEATRISGDPVLVTAAIDAIRQWQYEPTLLNGKPIEVDTTVTVVFNGDPPCRYMKSRDGLSGYESGGPYTLDHFRLTTGRTDLREFLWKHWHEHMKGVAEARVGTVDRGTVKALYLVQVDEQGLWGIDVELDRPMDPPCVTFHADSLVRVPIANPKEDYPSQTLGLWPPDEIPPKRLADSDVVDSKLYKILLVRDKKPASGDTI
jgi:TonB family protein